MLGYSESSDPEEPNYLDMKVPIYRMRTVKCSFKATMPSTQDAYFAEGCLVGNFYTIDQPVILINVRFIGEFKGVVQKSPRQEDAIYFEGSISRFLIIHDHKEEAFEKDPVTL